MFRHIQVPFDRRKERLHVKHTRPWFGGLAVLFAISFVAVSCGDSKDSGSGGSGTTAAPATESCGKLTNDKAPDGGELVDYAQLSDAGSNTSFDPSVVQTLDESQITSAVWDGLTDFDFTDKCSGGAQAAGRLEVDLQRGRHAVHLRHQEGPEVLER